MEEKAMIYQEIIKQQPDLEGCFFTFSNEQFKEGIQNKQLEGKKLYDGGHGLFGTKEGIEKLLAFYDNLSKRIAEKCDPQEVYNYEFANHECSLVNDDEEAIKIVISYFGNERSRSVKRRFAYQPVEHYFKKDEPVQNG